MSETNHPWCRDTARDEAIRAAEDAASDERTPLPDHRELPQAVAELRERVAKIEEAMVSGSTCIPKSAKPAPTPPSAPPQITEGDTLATVRDGGGRPMPKGPPPGLRAENREAAPGSRDGVTAAPAANAGGEAKPEPVAWGVMIDSGRGLYGHYDFEAEARGVCDAVNAEEGWSMTVVPLYAAPVAESATTPQPPRGWLTEEERSWLKETLDQCRKNVDARLDEGNVSAAALVFKTCERLTALLARETPPRVKVPHLDDLEADERPVWESACSEWIAAILAAGGEVE